MLIDFHVYESLSNNLCVIRIYIRVVKMNEFFMVKLKLESYSSKKKNEF
jgi:hypothetical protein